MSSGAGWTRARLGDLVTYSSGSTPQMAHSSFWNGTIPWITAKDLKTFWLHDSILRITPAAVASGVRLVPAGTILLLIRGMTLLNDVPLGVATREMAFNQDVKALKPRPGVDGEYLAAALVLSKDRLMACVDTAGHGTGRLATEHLNEVEVPVPPLRIQRTIAAVFKLEDKRAHILSGLTNAKWNLKRFLMSRLLSGNLRFPEFGGALQTDSWSTYRVDQLGHVTAGRQRLPAAAGRPRQYLRVANVLDGSIDSSDVYAMNFTDAEFDTYRLAAGDILLNEGQSIGLVGRAAMYDGVPALCAYQNSLIRFRAYEGVDRRFMLQLFRFFQYSGRFSRIAAQTTSIAHLGVSRLASFKITIPAIREQQRIAALLDTIDYEIELLTKQRIAIERHKRSVIQLLISSDAWLTISGGVK